MADTTETIADIVVEMRGMGNYQRYSGDHARVLAARLEAALKRERGDCAKLREALEKFCAYSAVALNTGMFNRVHLEALLNMAKAALAAPPRNCDRFADETDAQIAFLNEVWLISVTKETALERDKFENWTDEMRYRHAKWLLAPATEKEGGNDGNE